MDKANQSVSRKEHRSLNEWFGIISTITGFTILIFGTLVLIGWKNDITFLQTFGLGSVLIKPNLGAGFLFIGLSLLLLQINHPSVTWLTRVFTAISVIIGIITTTEIVFNLSSGFDEFLIQKSINGYNMTGPFRMALNAAISLLLSGCLLFYQTLKTNRWITVMEFSYVFLFSISLLGLVSNIFGLNEYLQFTGYPRMAVLAALLFILVCVGLFMFYFSKEELKITIEQILFSGLVFLGSTILYLTLLSFSGFNSIREIGGKVEQTQTIKNYLSELKGNITDIENGVRGYLISNDEGYLEPMKEAESEVPSILNELRSLIPDNNTQQEMLDTLQQMISERVEFAGLLILTIKNEGSETALMLFETGKGKNLSDKIRKTIASLENEEDRLLKSSNFISAQNAKKARSFILINFIFQITLLIIISTIVRKNINQRRKALNEVRLLNIDLDRRVKERTESLARSEERFRSTLETMIEGAQIIGFDWTYIYLNPVAIIHSRLSKNELLGKRIMDVWPGTETTELFRAIKKCLEDRTVIHLENEFKYTDESTGFFDLRIQPVPEGVFILSVDITERKKAEKSISFLAGVLQNINEFVSITDTENNISYVNQSWIRTFGYTEEEVLGKNIDVIVAPSNRRDILDEILNATLNGGWQGELINRKKDGTEFPVMLFTTIIYDNDQKPIALVGISRDISERKKADELKRVNEKRLQKAQEIGHLGYWQQEIGGNSVWASSEGMKIYGFPPNDGEILIEALIPCVPDIGKLRQAANDLIIHNKKYDIEFLIRPADGSADKIISAVADLERDEEGKPVRLLGVLQDITARRKTEAELNNYRTHLEELVKEKTELLQASMNEIQDLYENAPCGYHSLDLNGTFIRINNTELNWLGYSKEEVINIVKFADLLTPDSKAIFANSFPDFLKKGEVQNLEFELVRKDKSTFFVSVNATAIYDSSGKYLMSRSTLFDITERKLDEEAINQARKAAEDANRAKSEFLANMSHEIRTPMNAVLGYTELLGSTEVNQTQKEYLNSIKSSGRSLLTLINDILDLSKIEAGKLELEHSYVETHSFFSEFEQIFSLKAHEKGLILSINIVSGTPPHIYIDEIRVRQIVFNLLGNAVKFTSAGSIIIKVFCDNLQIFTYSDNKTEEMLDLVIEVSDTGIGISEELQDSIFDPFIQERRIKHIGGTGLGLAITKKLVSLMNGSISLRSEPGIGSTFTVRIPEITFSRDHISKEAENQVNPGEIRFEEALVLIADDVKQNRKYLIDALKNTSLKFIEAEDGSEALNKINERIPDLIITDIRMPKIDGFQLLKKIRENNELKHIPVIAYSASVLKDQKERIHQSEFSGLLIKPVNVSELYLALMNCLPWDTIKTDSTDNPESDVVLPEEITDLPKLVSELETVYYEIWKSFAETQPLAEIRDFGSQLIGLGEKHHSETIISYGKNLINAVDSFNIKTILILLKDYKNLIGTLRSSNIKN